MALYKYGTYLSQSQSDAFDFEHEPGQRPTFSGIYRCTGCGREIVAEEAREFPPQNHHQHANSNLPIRWKLIVYADHKAK